MKRKTVNKAIVLSTTAAMAAGSTTIGVLADSVTATSVKKDTIKDQTAVNILKPKSGYTYLSSVASAAKQDNIVTVTYENGEKAQIIFLENIFSVLIWSRMARVIVSKTTPRQITLKRQVGSYSRKMIPQNTTNHHLR